ncbi:hypothetical protein HNQ51_001092 [Inhella inkyongensis]|uniref:Uncharacterized protein n=1 Tax=Inhella inkyongensis TaxID=392593 RepID=A0A840S5N5_9BURK|nr:hypothetical protein [Inhella inkyongensis]MBB5203799.1 hypothetical protein [Inhella inkyongensis]
MVIELPSLARPDSDPDAPGAAWFDARLEGLFSLGSLAAPASLAELQHFARLMQTQGNGVEATRMLFDAPYAHTLLQAGRLSGCAPLAELADELFVRYQSAGQWLGIVN